MTRRDVAVGAVPTERKGPAMLGEQEVSPVKLLLSSGKKVSAEGGECPTNVGGNYTVFGGPLRLLSEYTADFHSKGYCVAEALIVPEVLEHLATVFARVENEREEARAARSNPKSGNFWMVRGSPCQWSHPLDTTPIHTCTCFLLVSPRCGTAHASWCCSPGADGHDEGRPRDDSYVRAPGDDVGTHCSLRRPHGQTAVVPRTSRRTHAGPTYAGDAGVLRAT